MTKIEQARSREDIEIVREMIRDYMAWLESSGIAVRTAPTFSGFEEELDSLPGLYAPPRGRMMLATVDGEPAGCVCMKPVDVGTCELKRLYVRPGLRGLKIGWKLLTALMDEARTCGYRRMVLDSHISMEKAHQLYEAAGFKRIPTPDDFPEELKPIVAFMECDLATVQGSA